MGSIWMIAFALVAGHMAPALGPGVENVDTLHNAAWAGSTAAAARR